MSSAADDPDVVARLLRARIVERSLELAVAGSSMVGIIESGSTVLVEAAAVPRPGQIWLCVDDEARLVVHRVREVTDGWVTSRGSGNAVDDEPLHLERLVGRVRGVVDPMGRSRVFGRWDQHRSRLLFRLRRIARRVLRSLE